MKERKGEEGRPIIIGLNEYAKQQDWNLEICEVSTVEEAFEVILQKVGDCHFIISLLIGQIFFNFGIVLEVSKLRK